MFTKQQQETLLWMLQTPDANDPLAKVEDGFGALWEKITVNMGQPFTEMEKDWLVARIDAQIAKERASDKRHVHKLAAIRSLTSARNKITFNYFNGKDKVIYNTVG